MLKRIYLFFIGKSQGFGLPKWVYCLTPSYIGDSKWKWFIFTIHTKDCLGGDTIFMYWRRKFIDKK